MSVPTDHHWLLADLHLGHTNVLKHDTRLWTNIDDHDEHLTVTCLAPAARNRTLWLLGDIAISPVRLKNFMDVQRAKWGKIILIRGNHDDKVAWKHRDLFDEAHEARYVRVSNDVSMYLSHYAHRTWRNSHRGTFHLHGHSHGNLPRWGKSMDVGAPCVGYKPICLTECVAILSGESVTNHHPPAP